MSDHTKLIATPAIDEDSVLLRGFGLPLIDNRGSDDVLLIKYASGRDNQINLVGAGGPGDAAGGYEIADGTKEAYSKWPLARFYRSDNAGVGEMKIPSSDFPTITGDDPGPPASDDDQDPPDSDDGQNPQEIQIM